MPVKKEVLPKVVKRNVEKVFQNPNKNKLNLRCQREHMFVRPAITHPVKASK